MQMRSNCGRRQTRERDVVTESTALDGDRPDSSSGCGDGRIFRITAEEHRKGKHGLACLTGDAPEVLWTIFGNHHRPAAGRQDIEPVGVRQVGFLLQQEGTLATCPAYRCRQTVVLY